MDQVFFFHSKNLCVCVRMLEWAIRYFFFVEVLFIVGTYFFEVVSLFSHHNRYDFYPNKNSFQYSSPATVTRWGLGTFFFGGTLRIGHYSHWGGWGCKIGKNNIWIMILCKKKVYCYSGMRSASVYVVDGRLNFAQFGLHMEAVKVWAHFALKLLENLVRDVGVF